MTVSRQRVRVTGIVQGVGYRPFVHALAHRLGVDGLVGNDAKGVFVEVEGDRAVLADFVGSLRTQAPPLAMVDDVLTVEIPVVGSRGFWIVTSTSGSGRSALVTPDTATCADCVRELFDPSDRRFGYPFVNCTNCGPRFTIARTVPYDRGNTTMSAFELCPSCRSEYEDPADRRFHAQPTCCPTCGPALRLVDRAGPVPGNPVAAAVRLLSSGSIVAVKGLGGYHLAVDAGDEAAVAALRRRKHRDQKPFAVMARSLEDARALCSVDADAEAALRDRRRPIVLLPRRSDPRVAPSVAPGNRELGIMLPYTPVHHLLAAALAGPVVLTSGNISDEPIAYDDADAIQRLCGIADAFLTHDRPIHVRTDDSVLRIVRGAPMVLRRSRGFVPAPVSLPVPARRPVLACGAQLKNTVCLARGRQAFVSHHIGDVSNYETFQSFTGAIDHFSDLFGVAPEVVAHDLHPDYLSTKHALSLPDMTCVGVQHHHAHIASCLADNGRSDRVIGVACDGTGYGPDGVLWGGEILVADLRSYERAAHLAELPLPGGEIAIRQPWRMAVSYLAAGFGGAAPRLDVLDRHADWPAVAALSRSPLSARTTSVGRLLDAIAALVGVRDAITYEGQAAIELEQRVDPDVADGYAMTGLDGVELFAAAVEDVRRGTDAGVIAARAHHGLAAGLASAVREVAARTGLTTVALSGGVFQNVVILTGLAGRLEKDGFEVLTHRRVPPNDGGISLGQAAVAAARTG